jgi:hypothetical protein
LEFEEENVDAVGFSGGGVVLQNNNLKFNFTNPLGRLPAASLDKDAVF